MPRRGMGRSADLTEWSTNAGRSLDDTSTPAPAEVASSAPAVRRPRKFTALLDEVSDARYAQLLADARGQLGAIATRSDGAGRIRTGYDLSRADVLRALLAAAEHDPVVRVAVYDQLRAGLASGAAATP